MAFNRVADILVQQAWQVTIVFGLVLAGSAALRQASAHWRYLLWLLVIAKCLTPPLVSVSLPILAARTAAVTQAVRPEAISGAPTNAELHLPAFPALQNSVGMTGEPLTTSSTAPTMTPVASRRFTLNHWLVVIWTSIVVTIVAAVAGRFWVTDRCLKRVRTPAGPATQSAMNELARTFDMRNKPAVYTSPAVTQPFVWGLIRGDIYVPPSFSDHGTIEQRHAVLAHELAHVARFDAAINFVQILVQSLFFFHPLVWWANRRIRHEREKCCDEIALSVTRAEPHIYCTAIVETLASCPRQSNWTPTLAVTGSVKDIEDRIVTMLTPDRIFQRRPSAFAFVTAVLFAVVLLPSALVLTSRTQSLAAADSPPAQKNAGAGDKKATPSESKASGPNATIWQPGQLMELHIIDAKTRKPLSGVTLELQNAGPGINFQDIKIQTTEENGVSMIPFPDKPANQVRIYPSKPGYVPLRVYWEGEPHAVMPKSITIPMDPGKEFGGIIRNSAGKPIPDVTVNVHYWAQGSGKNPHIRANIVETATSDAKGRWRLNTMPAEVTAKEMRIYVKHPDYLSDYLPRGFLPIPVIDQPPLKDLFAQTAVMVMADADVIEGKVLASETGKPIAGAKVFLSDVPWFFEPRTTSDKDGHFKIGGISRVTTNGMTRNSNYPLAVIVQAAGFAPELVQVGSGTDKLKIELNPGQKVHGQVVDEEGKAIPGATIAANQWRGRRGQLPLQTESAADGTFTIVDAPDDKVEYSVYKDGYLTSEQLDMLPMQDEYEVTLRWLVQVVGSVVDADTGKPLEKFSVMQGIDYDDGRAPHWMIHDKKLYSNAKYVSGIRQSTFKYRVRVEADGYMPDESRLIKPYDPDKGQIKIDFKLRKAANLTGTVETATKQPLANAEVYMVRGRMNINDRNVIYVDQGDPTAKTDAAGRFEFPPELEDYCVIVVHEQGLGMVTQKQFIANSKITIEPWDYYRSQLQIIPRPAQGESVDFPPKGN